MIELKELLEAKADQLGWSMKVCDDGSIELENWSPAGEDLVIDLTSEDPVREMRQCYEDFDVDEHVELWIDGRGKRGVPSSVRVLVEDAEEIERMYEALADGFEEASENLDNEWLREVGSQEARSIIETREPRGVFLVMEDGKAVGIDNGTGDAWTEEFETRNECLRWLLNWNDREEGEE